MKVNYDWKSRYLAALPYHHIYGKLPKNRGDSTIGKVASHDHVQIDKIYVHTFHLNRRTMIKKITENLAFFFGES